MTGKILEKHTERGWLIIDADDQTFLGDFEAIRGIGADKLEVGDEVEFNFAGEHHDSESVLGWSASELNIHSVRRAGIAT